jgi:hypothetical protein
VFDLESNGFIYEADTIWCLCLKDLETRETYCFSGADLQDGVDLLSTYDYIIGHNICGYDVPLIKKLYPNWVHKELRDTYCMSKLFNPERRQGHSLESYGEQFGRKKPEHEDWTQFSEEMLHRCKEDVEINCILYDYLVDKYCQDWSWKDSLLLEQQFAMYQTYQEVEGVDVDIDLANRLVAQIDKEVAELDELLQSRVPTKVVQTGVTITKPFKKDGTYRENVAKWILTLEAHSLG